MLLNPCIILLAALTRIAFLTEFCENLRGDESQTIWLIVLVLNMINTASTSKFSLKTAELPNASVAGSVTAYTLIYEEIYASWFQGMKTFK